MAATPQPPHLEHLLMRDQVAAHASMVHEAQRQEPTDRQRCVVHARAHKVHVHQHVVDHVVPGGKTDQRGDTHVSHGGQKRLDHGVLDNGRQCLPVADHRSLRLDIGEKDHWHEHKCRTGQRNVVAAIETVRRQATEQWLFQPRRALPLAMQGKENETASGYSNHPAQ